jgi:hypothetical protein
VQNGHKATAAPPSPWGNVPLVLCLWLRECAPDITWDDCGPEQC